MARQAGEAAYRGMTNALAQGKAFTNVCAELKIQPSTLPPFSLSTRSLPEAEQHLSLTQLKQLAFATPPGKVSVFQPTSDGGAMIFVKSKLPIDQTKMRAELPEFVNYVRQTRQNEAFNEWFRLQATKGLRDTPLGWPKPSPAMGSTSAKS
jgi:hypothetical protein